MEDEQRNKETPQDFRMRYQVAIDDIKYIKTRQWSVTYYLLLLYAALIGFYRLDNSNGADSACVARVLAFMAVSVALLGTYYLLDFQWNLSKYRKVIRYIIETKKLSDGFSAHENEKDWDEHTSLLKDPVFPISFLAILWLGATVVLYYLKIFDGVEMVFVFQKISNSIGLLLIVIGSLGMIAFATKFPLSARIKDLKLVKIGLLNRNFLNGWRVWKWSWILIISGSLIQIIGTWMF